MAPLFGFYIGLKEPAFEGDGEGVQMLPATSAECAELGVTVNAGGRSVEAVAADRPSAIVGVSIPTFVEAVDQYEAIAPTNVVDFTLGWEEQLDAVASAFGRGDEANRQVNAASAVAHLRADVEAAGRAGTSVSVLAGSAGGPFAIPSSGSVGEVLTDIGVTRPAAQQAAVEATAPFIPRTRRSLTAVAATRRCRQRPGV